MDYRKIYLMLLAWITYHVNAKHEPHLKASMQLNDISRVLWNSDTYNTAYAASETLPDYYGSYQEPGSIENQSKDHFGSTLERFPNTDIKRKPSESKNLKKSISPFYMPINNNSTKHKEFMLNPEVTHCRKIKTKSTEGERELRKGFTVCYKCKDPKTRSTYKRCSYNSHPEESASFSAKVRHLRTVPTSLRYRRSNLGKDESDHGKLWNPYRFADEYFSDATYDLPAAYESEEEKCDKIIRDSMVCMVCKNAKTNAKYEQCSYVKQPREKTYSYTESSSLEKPHGKTSDGEHAGKDSYSEFSDFKASNRQKNRNPITMEQSREYPYRNKDYLKRSSTANKEQTKSSYALQEKMQDAPSANCKQVQVDSKTCTVCKDSRMGGTYEKCSYNYEPSDKIYKYRRSKSFEYPVQISTQNSDEASQASNNSENVRYSPTTGFMHKNASFDSSDSSAYPWRFSKIAETKAENDFDTVSQIPSDHSSSDYSESEESNYEVPSNNSNLKPYEHVATSSLKHAKERSSEDINVDNCRKFQKDSMTCTICKDPKTGSDFEKCSYQPSDKVFSYSKSSSLGNSRKRPRIVLHGDKQSNGSETPAQGYAFGDSGPEQTYKVLTTDKAKFENNAKENKKTDTKYLDIAKKEVKSRNIRMKDRSKCKKIMRDKITCYRCTDEDSFQKEECFFTSSHDPEKDELVFHEVKEFQIDPTLHARELKLPNSMKTISVRDPSEPNASASRKSYVRLDKPDNDYPDEVSHITEETKESEPYDYTSETRSRYDTILGLTLPTYMVATSEHEAAFDEVVVSG